MSSHNTCTVDEVGSGSVTLIAGLTEILQFGAVGRVVLSTVVATSLAVVGSGVIAMEDSKGPVVTVQGHGVVTLPSSNAARAVLTAAGVGEVTLDLSRQLTLDMVGSGSVQLLPHRTLTLSLNGSGTTQLVPARVTTLLVAVAGSGTAAPLHTLEATAAVLGAGTTNVVLSTTATGALNLAGGSTNTLLFNTRATEVLSAAGSGTNSLVVSLVDYATLDLAANGQVSLLTPSSMAAWVMNTETSAMSRYANLPVESLARVGGVLLGLGTEGLFKHEGDTDNGAAITSSVRTGRMDFRVQQLKRLDDMIISYSCNGAMTMNVSVYGGTSEGTFSYDMPERPAESVRGNRFKVGRGLVSKFWQFEWTSLNGSRFKVTSGTVDVAPSTVRRL